MNDPCSLLMAPINMLKRIIYLGYYFKELDWEKLNKFIDYVADEKGISYFKLWKDSIVSSLKYNISITEYFLFRFYELSEAERATYAGTGYMYEYQKLMNPPTSRKILIDKKLFLQAYSKFVRHPYLAMEEIQTSDRTEALLHNQTGKIVLKKSDGQCGVGIEVKNAAEFDKKSLYKHLKATGNDMVEAFVQQHKQLNALSPSGLNTIRIITQLSTEDEVDIIGTRLRITVNSAVDNLAAGNIAAPIDPDSGIVTGPGIYSDITKEDKEKHPVTGVSIVGFKIPFWKETLAMVKEAALLHKENRSIGWDVAITDEGPELIEGNHDWCKLLWQLPVKRGLKPVLETYKKAYLDK